MSETAATQSSERQTVSLPQAERILAVGLGSIFRAAARGDVPTIRIGRRIVVSKSRARAHAANHRDSDQVN
jgi:hypothetical protein